jgi:hypothetical protein
MIMYSTRARIAGFAPDAVTWARQIAELVTKKTGVTVDVAARVGGHQDIIWVSRFDDMAALESQNAKIQADADYVASIKAATDKGLFDIGTVETAIWRTL